jgi:hypothetical protein
MTAAFFLKGDFWGHYGAASRSIMTPIIASVPTTCLSSLITRPGNRFYIIDLRHWIKSSAAMVGVPTNHNQLQNKK